MGRSKSKPVPPVAPKMKNVGFLILDNNGNKVTNAEVYVNGNKLVSDQPGGFYVVLEAWNKSIGVVVKAPNFIELDVELELPLNDSKNFTLIMEPIVVPVKIKPAQDIVINNNKFAKRIQGRIGFRLLELYIKNGPDSIKPYLEECRKYNVNMIIVFCSLFGWADLDPRTYPLYSNYLRDFIEFINAQGFNLELTALVGPELKQANYDKEFVQLVSNICAEYGNKNLFQIGNELWKWYSVAELKDLANNVNKSCIWSVTSPMMESNTYDIDSQYLLPLPEDKAKFFHGRYISLHTIRGEQQARRGKDILDIQSDYGVPCIVNEPFGAGEGNNRTNDPRQFIEFSAAASLFGGSYFHSTRSIHCEVLDGIELDCLDAFARGWALVPEEFMNGSYTRYGLGNSPIDSSAEPLLRSYFMILGNRACGVLIKQTNGSPINFVPSWTNGWKLAGNIQCVYMLEQ